MQITDYTVEKEDSKEQKETDKKPFNRYVTWFWGIISISIFLISLGFFIWSCTQYDYWNYGLWVPWNFIIFWLIGQLPAYWALVFIFTIVGEFIGLIGFGFIIEYVRGKL